METATSSGEQADASRPRGFVLRMRCSILTAEWMRSRHRRIAPACAVPSARSSSRCSSPPSTPILSLTRAQLRRARPASVRAADREGDPRRVGPRPPSGLDGARRPAAGPSLPNPNAGALYPVRPLLSRLSVPGGDAPLSGRCTGCGGARGMLRCCARSAARPAAAWLGAGHVRVFGRARLGGLLHAVHPGLGPAPLDALGGRAAGASAGRRSVALALRLRADLLAGDSSPSGSRSPRAPPGSLLEVAPARAARGRRALAAARFSPRDSSRPRRSSRARCWARRRIAPSSGFALNVVLGYTLSPWRLLELVVPYPFGDVWSLDDH